ncbi:MAG: hypothetical protein JNN11_02715 [Candidatus Doudnabacteria bacterium]|nr:hypothetical protein [Candidatus Doudnabacteria bacterium]
MQNKILDFDEKLINFSRKISIPLARFSLFVVYFWFGLLKILDVSPANPLVMDLQQKTLPFLSFSTFIVLFAIFEMFIGCLFLFPKALRLVVPLFILHMGMTLMPLVFLPEVAWQSAFVPTLEGQYIIKNLVLIALALGLASNLKPLKNV